MTHPLYLRAELQKIESQQLAQGLPLMERAGTAAARWIGGHYPRSSVITVLVGPGNNGGDGYVCARHLYIAGFTVHVWPVLHVGDLAADASQARRLWLELGPERIAGLPSDTTLVIDAVFGIGLNRPVPEDVATTFRQINEAGLNVVALDIPSGLDADSGQIHGCVLSANHTLTFIGDKPGLHTAHGQDAAGEVVLFELDLPAAAYPAAPTTLYESTRLPAQLRRHQESNKGTFGTVGVIGGAAGMAGAAILAGRAALRLGAGKVRIGMLAGATAYDPLMPELMLADAALAIKQSHDVWLVGPGLGRDDTAIDMLTTLLSRSEPLVLDADALNLLATHSALFAQCKARQGNTVITPHPAEAARLLNTETSAVQAQRLDAVRELASRLNAVALIKGSGTVISDGQQISINRSGNAALASAGQGDVLGGMIAALLAQGMSALEATQFGVYLHGAAADQWLQSNAAGIGLGASETVEHARTVLNRLK